MTALQDTMHFLSGQTARKLWNGVQVLSSYHASRLAGKPSMRGMPIGISLEPTTSCNLRCPECPSGLRSFTRPVGMLQDSIFRPVIDELAPTLSYLTFYFQGEPFLNTRFLDMVEYAAAKKIYTSTSTNAHFLKDETAKATVQSGLSRLIISIDGITQETYESYRVGGELEKVLEGTRNIVRWKKALRAATPEVIFQFLVVRPNEHQIEDVKALALELGVDRVVFKTAQIYDFENGSELMPENETYSRYKKTASGKYEIRNQLMNHCWKMWNSCVITWDGKVVPCCFDKDAKYVLGDVSKSGFREIWSGKKYNAFRASLLRSRREIDICRNCTEGTKVWA